MPTRLPIYYHVTDERVRLSLNCCDCYSDDFDMCVPCYTRGWRCGCSRAPGHSLQVTFNGNANCEQSRLAAKARAQRPVPRYCDVCAGSFTQGRYYGKRVQLCYFRGLRVQLIRPAPGFIQTNTYGSSMLSMRTGALLRHMRALLRSGELLQQLEEPCPLHIHVGRTRRRPRHRIPVRQRRSKLQPMPEALLPRDVLSYVLRARILPLDSMY